MRLYKQKCTYWYDFTLPGQPRVRQSTHETSKERAKVVAADAFAKARDNGGVDILLHKAPVLEVFAVEFVKWVKDTNTLGKHGRRYYLNGWGWLKDTPVAKLAMDKISNHDLETVKFPGKDNYSANCAIKTLRRMYGKAEEMKRFWGKRPKFKLLKVWARSIHMTPADAILIDQHWGQGEESQNSRDLFRVMCSSGFRPDECFRAEWDYMQWVEGVYCNPDGKTEAARRKVPLSLPPFNCLEVLKARWERMGRLRTGWIFPSPKSESGHMVTIQSPFAKARNRAGLPAKMCLYTARHGVCTRVAEVTTLKGVMQSMGHSDISTAMKYQHPDSKGISEKLWEKMKAQTDAIQ